MLNKSSDVSISFVLPCLNEARTLERVISEIHATAQKEGYMYEIIVADNGSTDDSPKIAHRCGARIIEVPTKGYGSALISGFSASQYDIILFADSDSTYSFSETPRLVKAIWDHNADLVAGDRLSGTIEKGAMPFLHRYLGTPVLSLLMSLLIGSRLGLIKDCNSGFRCFKKAQLEKWKLRSTGMEFASEMFIRALQCGSKIAWVPINLQASPKNRVPHLRTWRDGMRHLLMILVHAPGKIQHFGFLVLSAGLFFFFPSLLLDHPMQIVGIISIFGIHSMILGALLSVIGFQVLTLGSSIKILRMDEGRPQKRFFSEDKLFFLSVLLGATSILLFLGIFFEWYSKGFMFLSALKTSITALFLGALGFSAILFFIGIEMIHVILNLKNPK